ncbi:MAG: CoA pyrophosphatase [Actinomycetia bacterium]|nr:CoA pyrophosphatase [Actinomycetes bacterium]MCP4222787.1 CoA pyrophosphatase [Actinomycetes bacterium]MCP5032217.1 CoA pyrophosphatase [Actinomycetes bacterium]
MKGEPTEAPIRYDEALRQRLSSNLDDHDVRRHHLDGRRHAAVGIVVIDSDAELHGHDPTELDRLTLIGDAPGPNIDELTGRIDGTAGGAAILLTRRGSRLNAHANQWAFPGGRVDSGETPLEAAFREIEEEVNLTLTTVDLIGQLDDYPTRSGYVITPYVFWAGHGAEPEPNPGEVASVHRVSIRELTRHDSPRFVSIPESNRPVVQLPIGSNLIHAPTGAIIYQFRAVAYDGTPTRVDELEQPVFAWK